jgi:hypothetical protein
MKGVFRFCLPSPMSEPHVDSWYAASANPTMIIRTAARAQRKATYA